MKKRILATVMAIGLALSLFAATPFVSAAENDAAPSDAITVLIDDKPVVFEDAQPVIVSDRTMVPLRAIAESFDANVEWDGETRTVLISEKSADTEENTADEQTEETDEDAAEETDETSENE